MPQISYALSSEEHLPNDLVRFAAQAEEAVFGYDHVNVHQVGPDQQGFLNLYAREALPEFDERPRGSPGPPSNRSRPVQCAARQGA